MSYGKTKAHGRRHMWSFMLGLVLISLATFTNFYVSSKTRAEMEQLPPVLLIPYDELGQFGVTMCFVTSGLVVILYGLFSQLWATHVGQLHQRRGAHWGDYSVVYPDQVSTGSSMQLETSKYLNHWTPTEPIPAPPGLEPGDEPLAEEEAA